MNSSSGKKSQSGASSASDRQDRLEEDRLGKLSVPASALYGIHTQRALQWGTFSGRRLADYPDFVNALLQVKAAAAQANARARILPSEISESITRACESLQNSREQERTELFPVDLLMGGGSIAVNMNLNEVIANQANQLLGKALGEYRPVHPKVHVNASQSTSDVCHTAARMAILALWERLRPHLEENRAVLDSKSAQWKSIQTLSRTCLRDASLTSFGDYISGMAALIGRATGRLEQEIESMNAVNLGGTVIGSGEGAPKEYRAEVLPLLRERSGNPRLHLKGNLFDAAQNSDDLARVSAQLAVLAQALSKCARDIRLLSSGPEHGFGELILPAVMEGSSFYPGKINPIVPETVMQLGFWILGNHRAVEVALEQAELNLNVFEGAIVVQVFDSMEGLVRLLPRWNECIRGVEVNQERCESYLKGKGS